MISSAHKKDAENVILGVVRGDRPLIDLQVAGVVVDQTVRDAEVQYSIQNSFHLLVTATAGDIATGLLHYEKQPEALGYWARTIMAGSDFVDLALDEDDPVGDRLMDALWKASYGEPIPPDVFKVAKAVKKRGRA